MPVPDAVHARIEFDSPYMNGEGRTKTKLGPNEREESDSKICISSEPASADRIFGEVGPHDREGCRGSQAKY
ncbi:MAG: hypothetical protein IIC83_00440 [Chloroflexi bacterium]|nr:hypothetical protein [Chloroflexota bacterium]